MKAIALTTGDLNGVGCEITVKALNETNFRKNQKLAVFLHPRAAALFRRKLKHACLTVHSLDAFLQTAPGKNENVFLVLSESLPARWVEEAARACMESKLHALVTGPLSKPGIREAGLKDLGHTEILGRISGQKNLFMSFWGSKFNVILATGHLPLRDVPSTYSAEKLELCAKYATQFLTSIGRPPKRKKIAWLGLNPHAGDKSLIGNEDLHLSKQILKSSASALLEGPLVPDAAFTEPNWSRFAAYIAAYHDQGLIPFKLAHGYDEGVHVTLGLPFLRTSVDHGPAVDLVGTGKAKHGSMKAALQMALDFKSPKR